MAEQFQTSFIPKKTFDVGAPKPARTTGVVFTVAGILFALSLVSAGGVFAYERYLESSIANKREALQRAREAFEPELIRELSHLDTKIQTAEQLLNNHLAISGIFDLLQDTTLETVRFTSFSYAIEPEGIRLSMVGEARSFSSVALQSDEFTENRFISQPVFSGLTLDEQGDVLFSATALVSPAVASYSDRMRDGGTAAFELEPEVAGDSTVRVEDEPTETATDL